MLGIVLYILNMNIILVFQIIVNIIELLIIFYCNKFAPDCVCIIYERHTPERVEMMTLPIPLVHVWCVFDRGKHAQTYHIYLYICVHSDET